MEDASAVLAAVKQALASEPTVVSSNVAITLHGDSVILEGRVGTFAQKRAAERAVRRVGAVTAVHNMLDVGVYALDGDPDFDISATAFLALRWDADLPGAGIKAHVDRGVVTLSGEVDRPFQREAAEMAVARLRGVRGIVNDIAVKG